MIKVIMNLVFNAYEATPDGGEVCITTKGENLSELASGFDQIAPGNYVIIEIKDSGMGIPPDCINRIFEPYYSRKTMGTSGSGLGLAVVHGVIKDHKGYYDVFSEIDEGTRFILYFPAKEDAGQSLKQEKALSSV